MEVIRTCEAMRQQALAWRTGSVDVGLVPTMGYLHEGHLSLIRIARSRAKRVVVTLFVNPAQFGPNEDLDKYPRDLERDEALCRREGVDLLFIPEAGTMYHAEHSTWVEEVALSRGLCGASRPGHFRGVCTVVLKLLNLTLPDFMVLGEKDAQQLRVLRRMVSDLNVPVEILSGPTIRETDGLAMSSRNARLTSAHRGEAIVLWKALQEARARHEAGECDAGVLVDGIRKRIGATSGRVDYIEVVDDETLEPVTRIARPALIALAVFFGDVRLIDHITL